ncbi:thioredoxin fold domain-containing protein [Petrotoga sp. 9PWA.NaAc.5.4]|uniref:thioredoxin family protein n=1 Tax=Petrotoga sp. 9PWA.NaAc.5.4 TaxID=1434328 RepID=UPI000CCB7E8C|nr:thioredoxin fold domain-containing protein [Petrotoga sp. 9PWA.NaAc.5.4]PNR94853.1 hypothetical protein X924_05200 [Petrotoga sp. 9PWA.NaAc.5.4]
MKKFLLPLFLIFSVVSIFSVPLEEFVLNNFNNAFTAAKLTDKNVVVMFSTPTCPACKQFKQTTLLNEEVQNWLRTEYVFVEIYPTNEKAIFQGNEYTHGQLFYALGARYTPTFIFFDSEQNPFGAITGSYPPEIFIDVLKYVIYEGNEKISLDQFIQDNLGEKVEISPKTIYLKEEEINKLLEIDPNTKLYSSGKTFDPYTNVIFSEETDLKNFEDYFVKIIKLK